MDAALVAISRGGTAALILALCVAVVYLARDRERLLALRDGGAHGRAHRR